MTSLMERTSIEVYREEYIESLKEDTVWEFGNASVIICPNCGSEMVYKETKFGGMMGCKSYNANDENTCKVTMDVVDNRIIISPDLAVPICEKHKVPMRLRVNRKTEEENENSDTYNEPRFWGCPHYSDDGCRFTVSYEDWFNYDDWVADVQSHPKTETREMWIRKGALDFCNLPGDITFGQVIGEIYHAIHDDYVDFLRRHIVDLDMYARKEKEEQMGISEFDEKEKERYKKLLKHGPPGYDITLEKLYDENSPVDFMYIRDKTDKELMSYDEIYDEAGENKVWVIDIGKDVGYRGRRYIRIIRDLIDNPKAKYSIGKVIGYRKPFNLPYHVGSGKNKTEKVWSEGLRIVFTLYGVNDFDDRCISIEK